MRCDAVCREGRHHRRRDERLCALARRLCCPLWTGSVGPLCLESSCDEGRGLSAGSGFAPSWRNTSVHGKAHMMWREAAADDGGGDASAVVVAQGHAGSQLIIVTRRKRRRRRRMRSSRRDRPHGRRGRRGIVGVAKDEKMKNGENWQRQQRWPRTRQPCAHAKRPAQVKVYGRGDAPPATSRLF